MDTELGVIWIMEKNDNYDKLENDKRDTLLRIGENLLNIQLLINNEKLQEIKSETKNKKSDVNN